MDHLNSKKHHQNGQMLVIKGWEEYKHVQNIQNKILLKTMMTLTLGNTTWSLTRVRISHMILISWLIFRPNSGSLANTFPSLGRILSLNIWVGFVRGCPGTYLDIIWHIVYTIVNLYSPKPESHEVRKQIKCVLMHVLSPKRGSL